MEGIEILDSAKVIDGRVFTGCNNIESVKKPVSNEELVFMITG